MQQEERVSDCLEPSLEKFVALWDFEPSKKDEVALLKVRLSYSIFCSDISSKTLFAVTSSRLSNILLITT